MAKSREFYVDEYFDSQSDGGILYQAVSGCCERDGEFEKNQGFEDDEEIDSSYGSVGDVDEICGFSDFEDGYCGCSVCAQCGYRFTKSDDILKVRVTGDIIHRDCFIDYADDNICSLSEQVALSL